MKKKRNTSYSMTGKVIDQYGLDHIEKLGIENGMYATARRLKTSPYTIRYIAQTHSGKRDASKVPHLVKAVKNGSMKAEFYKTLDFSTVQTNLKSSHGETNE